MIIVINFKNYAAGKKSLELAKRIQKYLPKAIVCINFVDILEISRKTKLQVFAQHVNYNEDKRGTGFVFPSALKSVGARGSLLNHSEHKVSLSKIKERITECKKINLKLIVCASNIQEAKEIKKLKPWAIAFEDEKLISTGKSITKHNPKSVEYFVKILERTGIIPLCGAGINSKEDILEAKRLGCKGVLISSAVANSKHPEKILKEISRL